MKIKNLKTYLLNFNPKRKYNKLERDFVNKLSISASKLLKNYDTKNVADVDYILKGECVYSAFLWQETLVNQFNVFAMVLGVIDSRMDYHQQEMFNRKYDMMAFEEISKKRLEVSNQLKKFVAPHSGLDSIYNAILTYPSYTSLSSIYEENKCHPTKLSLHLKFINAYTTGYDSSMSMDLDKIMEAYESINYRIKIHEDKNNKKLQLAKTKNKKAN